MGEFGLTDLEILWDPALETKALLGWNASTVVLAFRGTASVHNACADLKAGASQQLTATLGCANASLAAVSAPAYVHT